ncbi:M3 family oligoendopeptidase [Brevibacillus composti]|uniref:M3 family oligoendopeptidase n=1 Tax=Brevibacillus composti TaxID=2796470 RepID=A0A7T5EJD7_9BACL|nr:M3 family oligoendopeptidase [Brevibacillus composti]QQE73676.1 M3 family oligoendopeptidase [Brevibacillus composti]QUO40759.1 M3 family oligoendopeptidase [Brevibacillus composti]
MEKQLPQRWDLDVFFPGGSASEAFRTYLDQLEADISSWDGQLQQEALSLAEQATFQAALTGIQSIAVRLKEAGAFISCLTAQNVKDEQATLLGGRVKSLSAAFASVLTAWDVHLMKLDETTWKGMLSLPEVEPVAFPLQERRRRAQEKLSPEQEKLANDLAVDGYHAWQDLSNAVTGRMSLEVEIEGEIKQLSVGQAANLGYHPDRSVREQVFAKWNEAWAKEAELFAKALNHLAGFRLALYRHRGWDSVLREPLDIGRMQEGTLDAMWEAINNRKDRLVSYLNRKARLLGVEKLSWHDVAAPIRSNQQQVSYDEAAAFILEQFDRFHPELARFSRRAFEEGWIEAEDRAGKRPGGFCSSFPVSGQSRVFMTYAGHAKNVSTLAHELGHAYHQQVVSGLPPLAQNYAMNVAETASTFAEMIVADAAVKHAKSDEERLSLLEDKLQQCVAFFMNIQARFLFEKRFYEQRKKGLVSVGELNRLMVEAQKEAYCDALSAYEPHFWASKLHFYITSYPFYNFPYTFGYLFSLSVYARALQEGPGFAEKYDALLRDTGRMTVEELAMRHLGEDITTVAFWQTAVDLAVADIEEFLRLTE